MDELIAYKLKFLTSLHLGQEGIGLEKTDETLHSDTIFSAILSKWQLFYDDDIETFIKNSPFLISSAFPFRNNEYFFPRPMIKIGIDGEENLNYGKKLKKVKFVSRKIFEKLISGETVEFLEKNTLQKGVFWIEHNCENLTDDEKIVYQKREVPRVIIDRKTNSSEIFYFNEIVFLQNCGLYFLVKFINKNIKNKFETILRLLGDEGIGGDKTSGKGCFKIEVDEKFKIESPSSSSYFTTLSLFHPMEEEIKSNLLKNTSYDLITRRGWIHLTSLKRKGIRMFVEGSVFKNVGNKVCGNIEKVLDRNENLGLQYNIYRYGIAFNIPLKVREENE